MNTTATMQAMKKTPGHTDWPQVLMAVCRHIERDEGMPKLAQLATQAGVSASELQRQFTRRLGVSPKAYAQALALQPVSIHQCPQCRRQQLLVVGSGIGRMGTSERRAHPTQDGDARSCSTDQHVRLQRAAFIISQRG